jgi:cytochrome P450
LLSQYPKWQKRASEEARSLAAIESPADLDRLEILDWVIRETLRLIPSAPWTTRIAAGDSSLGGHALPKGTEIVLSIFHTHRVERIYEQPNRFDPSRWQHIRPDVFEFNAFSAGARACIGMGFAMLEMKLILAMILRRIRVELDASRSVDPVLNITMAPRYGLHMMVHDKTGSSNPGGTVRGGIRRLLDLS